MGMRETVRSGQYLMSFDASDCASQSNKRASQPSLCTRTFYGFELNRLDRGNAEVRQGSVGAG